MFEVPRVVGFGTQDMVWVALPKTLNTIGAKRGGANGMGLCSKVCVSSIETKSRERSADFLFEILRLALI
jgi:hypothetical protein